MGFDRKPRSGTGSIRTWGCSRAWPRPALSCSFCRDLGYFVVHNKGLDETKAREVPRWRQSGLFTPSDEATFLQPEWVGLPRGAGRVSSPYSRHNSRQIDVDTSLAC
jgi:hypothetical protein